MPEGPSISVVPANQASCEDLRAIFGTRGTGAWCQCQRYKLRPGEAFKKFPVEERAHRLRRQTECGNPERGARAIEGYPIVTKDVIAEELHVGTEGVFGDAGFTVVSRPTLRRLVMRIDF